MSVSDNQTDRYAAEGNDSTELEAFERSDIGRRDFIKTTATVTGCAIFGFPAMGGLNSVVADIQGNEKKVAVSFGVNGIQHHLSLDPRTTLLDAWRESFPL